VQGIFLDELEQFAVRELGQTGLRRIRQKTGRKGQGYVFDASYPDAELALIVQSIAEATRRPPDEILEQFAAAMVPGLLEVYGFLVDPSWTFVDFLLNTEAVIHKGIRLAAPSAKPPAIRAQSLDINSVAITYRSPRRLCSVAKGILRGAAAQYHVRVAVREDSCMLRGDPECVITVSVQQ
jgi:hypothetical protein